jgi:adenylate cyclase
MKAIPAQGAGAVISVPRFSYQDVTGKSMTMQSDTLALVFIKLCHDPVNAVQGDSAESRKISARCLKLVAEAARRNGGKVMQRGADRALITFPTTEAAHRAARIIQIALRSGALRVGIAMHMGPVITTGDDVFGDAVNVVAHMLDRAGPDHILMTRQCVDALPKEHRAGVRLIDTTSIGGRPQWIEIYSAVADAEMIAGLADSQTPAQQVHPVLVLTYKGRTVRIDSSEPLSLGRDATCGLQIASALASRTHATLEMRDDGLVITDHSRNGSFVVPRGEKELHLKRATHRLESDGVISLGITSEANPRDLIHYRCEAAVPPVHAVGSTPAPRVEVRECQTAVAVSDAAVAVFRVPNRVHVSAML